MGGSSGGNGLYETGGRVIGVKSGCSPDDQTKGSYLRGRGSWGETRRQWGSRLLGLDGMCRRVAN